MNREVSEGKLISDHSLFFSCESQQGAANGQDSWRFFRDVQDFGRLDADLRAASPAQGLRHYHGPRYFNFPYFCMIYGLKKLGLVDQNSLERDLSALLLRALAVGRQQKSESIEFALDMR